ncbi:MAG: hypothetical protein CMF46_03235 [Legionellales bacterium]|nr:hypothetical protein [Legionellales bacterium]
MLLQFLDVCIFTLAAFITFFAIFRSKEKPPNNNETDPINTRPVIEGLSLQQALEAGYTREQILNHGVNRYPPTDFRENGFLLTQLKAADMKLAALVEAGFTINDLQQYGQYTIDDLLAVNINTLTIINSGAFSLPQLLQASNIDTVAITQRYSNSLDTLKDNIATTQSASKFTVASLKQLGYSLNEIRQIARHTITNVVMHYQLSDIYQSDYASDFIECVAQNKSIPVRVGSQTYEINELYQAGFNIAQLKRMGCSDSVLSKMVMSPSAVQEVFYATSTDNPKATISDLIHLGMDKNKLKTDIIGIFNKNHSDRKQNLERLIACQRELDFSIAQLRAAGLTIGRIYHLNLFTIKDILQSYPLQQIIASDCKKTFFSSIHVLKTPPYTVTIYDKKYTLQDLVQAGMTIEQLKNELKLNPSHLVEAKVLTLQSLCSQLAGQGNCAFSTSELLECYTISELFKNGIGKDTILSNISYEINKEKLGELKQIGCTLDDLYLQPINVNLLIDAYPESDFHQSRIFSPLLTITESETTGSTCHQFNGETNQQFEALLNYTGTDPIPHNPFKMVKNKQLHPQVVKWIIEKNKVLSHERLLQVNQLTLSDLVAKNGEYKFNLAILFSMGFSARQFEHLTIQQDDTSGNGHEITNTSKSHVSFLSDIIDLFYREKVFISDQHIYRQVLHSHDFWQGVDYSKLRNIVVDLGRKYRANPAALNWLNEMEQDYFYADKGSPTMTRCP